MFNSIGPLGLIGLLFLFIALYLGGLFLGFAFKQNNKPHCFSRNECLVLVVDCLFIGGGIFMGSSGDAFGVIFCGLGAALVTGLLWGLSNSDFTHTRMF